MMKEINAKDYEMVSGGSVSNGALIGAAFLGATYTGAIISGNSQWDLVDFLGATIIGSLTGAVMACSNDAARVAESGLVCGAAFGFLDKQINQQVRSVPD